MMLGGWYIDGAWPPLVSCVRVRFMQPTRSRSIVTSTPPPVGVVRCMDVAAFH